MMVKGVGNGAGAFLRNAEVIQRVGVSVVGIEGQAAIGARPQGHEAGLVVRVGEASAPIYRTYLCTSRRHGPGGEVRLQKEPECTCTVSRPEGIAVSLVKKGRSLRAVDGGCRHGIRAKAAPRTAHHSRKPWLRGHRAINHSCLGDGAGDTALQLTRYRVEGFRKALVGAFGRKHVGDVV